MIRGRFNQYGEPCINIQVEGLKIEVIVDTGFAGALWVPKNFLKSLNLKVITTQRFSVADGHFVDSEILRGKMVWFGREISVEIIPTESNNALLGTELLRSCSLFIHFPTKQVEIRKARRTLR
jgi:clan AA aspartic protease